MTAYSPLKISGNTTGLVQSREEFILPDDAYPVLENAFVWRERLKRKEGFQLIGRLRRNLTGQDIGSTDGSGNFSGNIISALSLESSSQFVPGLFSISDGTNTFTDNSDGILTGSPAGSGTINYSTGAITITGGAISHTLTAAFSYYPMLPLMGLRNRDLNATNNQLTIAFDTTYAYIFTSGAWREYIPGTTWTGNDSNFFWHTNYWVDNSNNKLFWVTNFSGPGGDPIRYSNGVSWTDFAPQIDVAGNVLAQCLCILPYRGRLVVFNTYEGGNLATSVNFPQRIRWAAIGSPIATNAWRDDIPGKGGLLDIPTNEQLVSVGFVRDNLVIYCSRSTWQLRYTGRTIQPFQLEKVNSELGTEGTFSSVQFDESLVGIGDKGIVECDSYKSHRIDIKIPDLIFTFDDQTPMGESNSNTERIQGVRDFIQRLAFWTYTLQSGSTYTERYPNRRLVYNYENDSWAIFTDSLTALGTFYPTSGRTWQNTKIPWQDCHFPWANRQASTPDVIGGNQQGFVMYLDSQVTNDPSLSITAITGNTTTPTVITSPNHNIITDTVIKITGIVGSGYSSLNNGIFSTNVIDANTFQLFKFNSVTQDFDIPQLDTSQTYIGGGQIAIRDNFYIQSKKFNYADQGESIQLGYIDLLMPSTNAGAITMQVFANYNETAPVNILPQNTDPSTGLPDGFFNSIIQTSNPNSDGVEGTKYMQRIYCPTRANYITIVYTLSDAQLNGMEQESAVQIDMQILWQRPAGRFTNV